MFLEELHKGLKPCYDNLSKKLTVVQGSVCKHMMLPWEGSSLAGQAGSFTVHNDRAKQPASKLSSLSSDEATLQPEGQPGGLL